MCVFLTRVCYSFIHWSVGAGSKLESTLVQFESIGDAIVFAFADRQIVPPATLSSQLRYAVIIDVAGRVIDSSFPTAANSAIAWKLDACRNRAWRVPQKKKRKRKKKKQRERTIYD